MVDILGGRHLVTRKGAAVEAEAALQNKVVALYFAAARCGPSRDFTQLLCDFYTALVAEARRPAPFEVVFVSADDSSQEMLNFMRELHGTWLALPFHDPYRHSLNQLIHAATFSPCLHFLFQAIWWKQSSCLQNHLKASLGRSWWN
ncbi:PREDICTED: nucleoredoxin-like protein 2 isoform X2 [Colobus angolensis palliatus]|uniref:nucleoredoxin-like protein 2 isoform X2 n=1 Tax=Colobus angolensis palliatus TaxID=336983 RepID=UPI0005F44DEC|nr:PREDICTED: nucleoredoxin-like protein 2 isoform X2 [Colobus angolensis palliatus]